MKAEYRRKKLILLDHNSMKVIGCTTGLRIRDLIFGEDLLDTSDGDSAVDPENLNVSQLSVEELDRDFAEISADLDFLEAQVESEIANYTPKGLESADQKIARYRKQKKLLMDELEKRKQSEPTLK
jgi:hypothetical protein